MRRRRPDGDWRRRLPGPALRPNSLDAVALDKGTLDAFCCDRDAKQAARRAEQRRPGRVLRAASAAFCSRVSFSETRLRHLQRVTWAAHTVDTLRNERNQAVRVYVCGSRGDGRSWSGGPGGARYNAPPRQDARRRRRRGPEPTAGAAQCNYELLKSFTRGRGGPRLDARRGDAAGRAAVRAGRAPALGARRRRLHPGAGRRGAAERVTKCAPGRRDATACGALLWRGFVDKRGDECCGFGYKAFHASSTACELDVLVLAAASYAPGRTASGSAGRRGRRFPGSLRHFHMKRARRLPRDPRGH